MTHRFVVATGLALALVLGGSRPAFALTRQATFQWAPASGPVAGYAVYASINGALESLVAYVGVPSATLNVESSVSVRIRVAAYDSAGSLGPSSATSSPVRLCPGDFDGDEIVGARDWYSARSCFGQVAQGFCAAADMDFDGLVRGGDIATVALKFGADACPPALCMGDFDGDHAIGLQDLAAAQACFGQPALGACAAGDFDGDGMVTLADAIYLKREIGSDACSL